MKKYKIIYNYNTGDSNGTFYFNEDALELEFNKYEVAQANLKRIEEHYLQYLDKINYLTKFDDIVSKNSEKDWFVKRIVPVIFDAKGRTNAISEEDIEMFQKKGYKTGYIIAQHDAINQIILYTDNGKKFQIYAPWCGYFESLNSVRIEANLINNEIRFN
jgi:hypothetical protein